MTYRPYPKYATRDAHAGPLTTCDRCGMLDNGLRMQFQFDFKGGAAPQNTGLIVCDRCQDDFNFQQKLLIIPPDPPTFYNVRPESYTVDETNWLTTESGDIINTQDGEPLIQSIPNPGDTAVAGTSPDVEEAAVNITTEDGTEIVTEQGDGNPLNIEPNPPAPYE